MSKFDTLINELRKLDLPEVIVLNINGIISEVEQLNTKVPVFRRQLGNCQSKILRLLEKELKLVPRNYYRTLWMAIGPAAFGIPIGIALGAGLGNMGFIAIGLPLGMVIGMALGAGMDKKAFEEGRQLNVDLT
jgi:hypothetical protein